MLTAINAALKSAASLYVRSPGFACEAFGEGQFMIIGPSDAIKDARFYLARSGFEVFDLAYGTILVSAAQPPAPLVPELDEEEDAPDTERDDEQPESEDPTEYDHEAALEAYAAWI